MDLAGKKVTVVGMARSGVTAARLLAACKALVTVTDIKKESELAKEKEALELLPGVQLEFGGNSEETLLGADLIVVSPGVDTEKPLFLKAKEKGVEIIGELELACAFLRGTLIAVTGTKGKTTTATLIGEMLKEGGKITIVGGNIGKPLTGFVKAKGNDPAAFYVAEVSSFQLETVKTFKPKVAAILNIGSDHMDRYIRLQDYVQAKGNIFRNQTEREILILNANDKFTPLFARQAKAKIYYFDVNEKTSGEPAKEGVFLRGGDIVINVSEKETVVLNRKELIIRGEHNVENAMVAALTASIMGVACETIAGALRKFKGVEHREEFAGEINGIRFINNSQGTNMLAVEKSLQSFEAPVILIAGGRNKGSDFTVLEGIVGKKVKNIVVMGEAKEEIKKALGKVVSIKEAEDMAAAVKEAYALAVPGDVVLLSPGCASFDMFKDYAERGDIFKAEVRRLQP
ncbi:MAG: UDP-N-acetylmuramoyl-L-alanine--D-glutamate ligase [Candidatus Firestonebacteria bacterium]|nr:UDP-N-acetylmuramoyl-L-alanine--D-glutamate ligase [Candidatus Firestonebacteria bacterium]